MTASAAPRPLSYRELLDEQDGVLSRVQALRAGMTEDAWQWRHETGRLQRLLPGVSVAHSGEPTSRQCAWAAVLHCGPGAAVTGDVAMVEQRFRMTTPASDIHVAVPERRVVRAGAVVLADPPLPVVPHRAKRLSLWVHPARRPPVLRFAPSLLHAVAQAPTDRAGEWRVAAAVQQRLVRPSQIRTALDQMPRLPRHALVAAVLDDVEFGAQAHSELEFLRLLRRNGLPPPDRLQRLVRANGKRYLDAWWEGKRVAVEIDGAHHIDVGQWGADALRANDVVISERHDRVLLLRFTTGNLRHDEQTVVRQLRDALL